MRYDSMQAILDVSSEYQRAVDIYPMMNSPHEGLAIILEEFEELKEEVWKKQKNHNKHAMRKEAAQIAAMAVRFMVDVT